MSTESTSRFMEVLRKWKHVDQLGNAASQGIGFHNVLHDDVRRSLDDKLDNMNERGEGRE